MLYLLILRSITQYHPKISCFLPTKKFKNKFRYSNRIRIWFYHVRASISPVQRVKKVSNFFFKLNSKILFSVHPSNFILSLAGEINKLILIRKKNLFVSFNDINFRLGTSNVKDTQRGVRGVFMYRGVQRRILPGKFPKKHLKVGTLY